MPFTLPALRGRGASARGGAPNQTVRCSSCPLSRPAGSGRGALLKAAVAAPPLERGVSFDGLPLLQELPRSNAVAAPTPDPGASWIDMFDGRDATEVVYAFHSDRAHALLSRLPRLAEPPASAAGLPPVSPAQRSFRLLRARLERDGWFDRDWRAEAAQLAAWAACLATAVAFAHAPAAALRAAAFVPLGLSFTAAGWLAHDYIHGRGAFCSAMRNFGGWAAGFGATMWSEKHNRHHALTNEVGQDEDLSGGPVLFLWAPDPARDTAWRRAQGAYFQAAFALLHLVWRWDSFLIALRGRPPAPPPHPPLPVAAPLAAGGPAGLESPRVSAPAAVSPAPPRRPRAAPLWRELVPILGHYLAFLAVFPLPTFVGGVLLGGWIMANVVTTSHQSEELLMEPEHDWVLMQFRTTRDAEPAGPLMSWLWGGMQHQLEHHLFPTMPRSKYADLVPVIKAFASEHGLPYKSEGVGAILVRNWNNYARVAAAPAVPGAKAPRKGVTL